jgi:segregation and condensation protein B
MAKMSELNIKKSLEAILILADDGISEIDLATTLQVPTEVVEQTLGELAAEYVEQDRGFCLRKVAGGWRYYSNPDQVELLTGYIQDGQQQKLTQAALETLAVIAYRQPVSRARVSAIRGVSVDAVMKTLSNRGLVDEAGVEHETGAILYQTTPLFLEKLGLAAITDLPALAPFLPDANGLEEVLATLTE